MRESPVRDVAVGLFVLAGLAAIVYLSVSIGGASLLGGEGMRITATFDEIGGLKPRAGVVVGGVKVGQVESIGLDEDLRARVVMAVDPSVDLPVDTSASILTSGVLGDQYVALQPGAEEETLRDGDELVYTQGAVILERLIGRMVQDLGAGADQ